MEDGVAITSMMHRGLRMACKEIYVRESGIWHGGHERWDDGCVTGVMCGLELYGILREGFDG